MYVHIFQRSTLKCLEMSNPGMTLDSPETEEKPQGSIVVVSGPVQGMNSRSPVQSWESLGMKLAFLPSPLSVARQAHPDPHHG